LGILFATASSVYILATLFHVYTATMVELFIRFVS